MARAFKLYRFGTFPPRFDAFETPNCKTVVVLVWQALQIS
jgi:hypothetical protein